MVKIHPTACVESPCSIGPGSLIWHYTHIRAGARLGSWVSVGYGGYIGPSARIGNGVRIQNHVSIFDGVEIADYVFIGPQVVFTNVRYPRAFINQQARFEVTRVQRGASIGANSTILPGIRVGPYALVAAGSVVTDSVPAFALVAGAPAVFKHWVCYCARPLLPLLKLSKNEQEAFRTRITFSKGERLQGTQTKGILMDDDTLMDDGTALGELGGGGLESGGNLWYAEDVLCCIYCHSYGQIQSDGRMVVVASDRLQASVIEHFSWT